jgi:hypothetical protein
MHAHYYSSSSRAEVSPSELFLGTRVKRDEKAIFGTLQLVAEGRNSGKMNVKKKVA